MTGDARFGGLPTDIATTPPTHAEIIAARHAGRPALPSLTDPLTTVAEAEAWLLAAYAAVGTWHPDDSAATIVVNLDGDALWTPEQCPQIDARMDEVFALIGDRVYEIGLDAMHAEIERAEAGQ